MLQRTSISEKKNAEFRAVNRRNLKEANYLFLQILAIVNKSKNKTDELELIGSFVKFFLHSADNLRCLEMSKLKIFFHSKKHFLD